MVALFVSTSMTSWSVVTALPTPTIKRTTVASAMDSPNWGMTIATLGIMC